MAGIPQSNEPPGRRATRLALGTTATFVLAQFGAWPLAHLAPVLVVILLFDPTPLPVAKAWRILWSTALVLTLGVLITLVLSPWPLLLVVVLALLLYRMYLYMLLSGAHTMSIVCPVIGFVVIPVLVILLPELGFVGWMGFLIDYAVAIPMAWITWLLMPASAPAPEDHHAAPVPPGVAAEMAATLTLVILPLMLIFLMFGLAKVLVLAYAVIFSTTYSSTGSREMGASYIIANSTYAGLAMLICYELLVMVPSIPFMFLLVFLALLLFGRRLFGGGPTAAYWESGCFGFTIMLGAVLMKDDISTSATVVGRLWQLFLAGAWLVFAFSLVEMCRELYKRRRGEHSVRPMNNPGMGMD